MAKSHTRNKRNTRSMITKSSQTSDEAREKNFVVQEIESILGAYHCEILLWRDSYAPPEHDGWHKIGNQEKRERFDDYVVLTLGLVVAEDEHYVKVVQNYGQGEVMNEIIIPKGTIHRRIPFDIHTLITHIDMDEVLARIEMKRRGERAKIINEALESTGIEFFPTVQ